MGWQDDAIVAPAAPKQPWENDQVLYQNSPKAAQGVWEHMQAGWQSSATGLISRGKLPDIQLDPQHSKWYERLATGITQMGSDLPEMIVGGIGGAAVTSLATANPFIGIMGGGAGAFALPTAIRESYIQALQSGQADGGGDFLSRATIVLKHTGKDALIGAATAGLGKYAELGAATFMGGKVMNGTVSATTARVATDAAKLTTEAGTLVVTPAALEGRLPEKQDFIDAAVLLLGLKGAMHGAGKLMEVYKRTGKTPIEVVADAKNDPSIVEDLAKGLPVEEPKLGGEVPSADPADPMAALQKAFADRAEQTRQMSEQLSKMSYEELDAAHADAKAHNDAIESAAVEQFLGAAKRQEFDALKNRRAKDKWLDDHVTDDMQDFMNRNQVDENLIRDFRIAANNFDTESPEALGRSIALISRDVDKPGFMLSPDGLTFRNAMRFAKEQGWDMEKVLAGMRSRSAEWAGDDAPELFGRLFRQATEASQQMSSGPQKLALPDLTKKAEPPKPTEAKPTDPLAEYGPEIPRAYEGLARDMNAREAVPEPSAESGKFAESAFAPIPQAAGEPILPTHLNYNFLNTADDIKAAMARLSELYEQKMREATRGTVSWEQTYAEAKALYEQVTGEKAPAYGVDNADYAKLAADIFARKQLLISGVERLMELRKAYIAARDAGTATPEMRLEFLAQVDRVAQAQAAARGSQAEVGRALNILKSTNRDKAYYDELERVLNSKFGETGGRVGEGHVDTLMDMLGDMGTPEQALKFAEKAAKATTWQKFIEAWKAGLVSGPFTQVANILGNVTFEATRPLVDAVAVAINKVTPGAERMSAVEPLARVIGNIQGVVDGSRAAWSTILTGENSAKLDQHRKAIEGTAGEIIRTPFRLLSAMDAFFRVSNERGEAWALATRQASNEGLNPATREFRQRMMEIINNPTEKQQEQIDAAGQRFTFNTPLGDKGQSVQNTIRKLHLEWAIPFVQTPANVAKEMLRLTPAAPIIGEWRAAIAEGGAARDKAIAEMAVGTAVATAVFSFALSKNISGQGDPDPKKRAGQLSAGWQPYSIKIGDTWYSYQRLQPVGTLLGMAADMAEVWEHLTPDESDKIPKILSTAFANAITNQTFLQGVTNIVNAISDPSRFGPKFVQGLAASTIPGIVGQTAQMMDPYKREVDSVLDAVKARIPGLSETLRPKRDIYGEKVPAADRLGEISPVVASKESTDKARTEVLRLGVGVAKAPDHIQLPSGKDDKLGKVKLTSEQRDVFADAAGHLAHEVISQMVNTPTWDNMPNLAQKNALNRVFEVTRKYGEAKAVPPEQIQAEATRISTELMKKLQPK